MFRECSNNELKVLKLKLELEYRDAILVDYQAAFNYHIIWEMVDEELVKRRITGGK
jgi:hypothetical protein